jgi:hypothetical protein
LQEERQKADAELQLQKAIKQEREQVWKAQKELARLENGKAIA